MSDKIPVLEIFGPTIQGEGPHVGARCIFVRVKGCSFACKWCDSKFTWNSDPAKGQDYTPSMLAKHLISLCERTNCNRIVLTGGNPCLYDFTEVLLRMPFHIAVDIETQGDLFPVWLGFVNIDTVVFSPKAPSSGMPDTYNKITEYIDKHPGHKFAIKIPVFNDEDIEFARKYAKFVHDYKWKRGDSDDSRAIVKMYLSVGNTDVNTTEAIRDRVLADYESLLNKINENPTDFQDVFILPQLHTLVWGNKQGV